MSVLPCNNFSGNFKSPRAKVKPSDVFAYLQIHREDVREVLRICRIDGCFDIRSVRKELSSSLRYGGIYAIELNELAEYLTTIFDWRDNQCHQKTRDFETQSYISKSVQGIIDRSQEEFD